jgi:hypothetical protein
MSEGHKGNKMTVAKISLFLLVAVLVFNTNFRVARADTVITQTISSTDLDAYLGRQTFTTTGLLGNLTAVKMKMKRTANASSCTEHFFKLGINGANTNAPAVSTNSASLTGTEQIITFFFDGTFPISSITSTNLISFSGGYAPCNDWDTGVKISGSLNNPYSGGVFSSASGTSQDMWFEIHNELPETIESTIVFQSPVDGQTTPDFTNYWVCITIPTDEQTGYNVEVFLADNSNFSAYTSSDNTADSIGLIPIYAGETVDECIMVTKSLDLTAGTQYRFQANLLDPEDNVIATTDEILVNIATGTKVNVASDSAPNITKDKYLRCLSTGGISGDVASAFCKIGVLLFVPDESSLDNFKTIQTSFATHAPFSYFYQLKTALDAVNPSAASMPSLTLNIGGALPVQAEMFGQTAINKYTTSGLRTTLRGLIVISLYLAFCGMVLFQTRKLFHK